MKGLDVRVAVTLGSSAGGAAGVVMLPRVGGSCRLGFACLPGGQGAPHSCAVKQLDKVSQERKRSSQNPQMTFLAIWGIRELHQPNVGAVGSKSKHPMRP